MAYKNPNNLIKNATKPKYTNPYDSYKSKEISDIDDAYYWAFQNALDYDEEPSLEDIEQSLDRLYDERNEFDDPEEFKKIYGRRGDFIHNGLTKWNDHNKVNPTPRRSDVQVWRDRAKSIPVDKLPIAVEELDDETIQELIDAFGFNRNGEW